MDGIASQLGVVVSHGNLVGTGRGCWLSPCRLRGIWHVLWPLVMMQFFYAFLPRMTAKPSFFYETHKCCLPFSGYGGFLYVLDPPSFLVSSGYGVVLNAYREPVAGEISWLPSVRGQNQNAFLKLKAHGVLVILESAAGPSLRNTWLSSCSGCFCLPAMSAVA